MLLHDEEGGNLERAKHTRKDMGGETWGAPLELIELHSQNTGIIGQRVHQQCGMGDGVYENPLTYRQH